MRQTDPIATATTEIALLCKVRDGKALEKLVYVKG